METGKQEETCKRLSIAQAFAEIPEPRVAGRSTYDLVEILVLAACAMVCGVDDFVGIEAWGNERIDSALCSKYTQPCNQWDSGSSRLTL
jgi:hypothetical protein